MYRVEKFRVKTAYGDTGTTVRRISHENFAEQLVPLPDLPTQLSINEIISLVDQKIANNKSLSRNLETLAQSVFKSWFIDFDQVHAKRKGEKPFGVDAETAKLFPDSFVKSEIGDIPKGWKVRSIGDSVIKQKPGKLYDTKTSSRTGAIPILDQGRSGFVGYHNDEPGVVAEHQNPKVVFANHTCSLRLISYPFSVIQNVFPLEGNDVDTNWLYFAIEGKQKFDTYKGHWPDFIIHEIIQPPMEVTKLFRRIIFPLMDQKWTLEEESISLIKLRDAILPKLVEGALVPDLRSVAS
jgi:type I restriction enzyme S subunit